jgi:hypothetical protein
LVDVGVGLGTMTKGIAEAFPPHGLHCVWSPPCGFWLARQHGDRVGHDNS